MIQLVWHGTAAIELIGSKGKILFDPFVPLDGAQLQFDISEYDGCTDIFVTHGHFDHIMNIPEIVQRNPDVVVYCTQTPYFTLHEKGVSDENLYLISDHSELVRQEFKIRTYPGKHAVLPKASYGRVKDILISSLRKQALDIRKLNKEYPENDETLFYEIEMEGKRIQLLGSLNLRDDIDYPIGCDLLVLPYNGWDDNLTPAINVIERLQPKRVCLDHYDNTFSPITTELDLNPILNHSAVEIQALHYLESVEL